jgi:hypothetical protein
VVSDSEQGEAHLLWVVMVVLFGALWAWLSNDGDDELFCSFAPMGAVTSLM